MIIASMRISKDTDKTLVNRQFADMKLAELYCDNMIGNYSDEHGLVEFIVLTDYETMNSYDYEIERGK